METENAVGQSEDQSNAAILVEAIPNKCDSETIREVFRDIEGDLTAYELTEEDIKSPEEFLEEIILEHAQHDTPCRIDMATSTPEEKAKERIRRLNAKTTRHRFVFQQWPRDPKGGTIVPDHRRGKETPNAVQLWGATLFDLYFVRRVPELQGFATLSSGSKLAAWMKEHGELKHARGQLQDAEEEDEPRLVLPWAAAEAIKACEARIGMHHRSWNKQDSKGKGRDRKDWELPKKWPPKSVFDASAYPDPWPREPFTKEIMKANIPMLQQYIMPAHLPAKLIVHDPWKLLNVDVRKHREDKPDPQFEADKNKSWSEMKDIKHIYKLLPSVSQQQRKLDDLAELEAAGAKRKLDRELFLKNPHTNNTAPDGFAVEYGATAPGPCRPHVYIVLPYEEERTPIPEAHLYISPAGTLGKGNHSFVYSAEFQLPRDYFVDSEICDRCVFEDAEKQLAEQDGPNGERRDPKWNELSGRKVVKTLLNKSPSIVNHRDEEGAKHLYLARKPEVVEALVYEGPYRVIESRVPCQDLSKGLYCKHLREHLIHPLTTTMKIAAKLSIEGDEHLRREASNYQAFPRHFFEHWSGYNVIHPLHDPVPVGALVPQFYGYYVVDEAHKETAHQVATTPEAENKESASAAQANKESGKVEKVVESKESGDSIDEASDTSENKEPDDAKEVTDKESRVSNSDNDNKVSSAPTSCKTSDEPPQYLSPILLLEQCGIPIEPKSLTRDDIHECASLYYRFHTGWWVHGSAYPRNIVRQPGPLSTYPLERMANATERGGLGKDWSYRLIDFGRSYMIDKTSNSVDQGFFREEQDIRRWVDGYGNSSFA